jgi:hypothetical protein
MITIGHNILTTFTGFKSLLFCFVCSMKSDRILKWSNNLISTINIFTIFEGRYG